MRYLADKPLGPGFSGFGPLGNPGGDAPSIFNRFMTSTVGVMSVIAFIWFIFLLLSGAYGLMGAGGDKEKLESSRKKITSGIVGIVVIIAAIFIIDLIGFLIGVPDILNPGKLIEIIGIGGGK